MVQRNNSNLVDQAVVTLLLNDGALAALMPDGVYFTTAPLDAARFVSIELLGHVDTYGFNYEAWETFRYQIKAVAVNSNGSEVSAAADRIHALLLDEGSLAITGYAVMRRQRMEYLRYLDVDPDNPSVRWQHRGGLYELQVTAIAADRAQGALVETR